VNKSTISSGFNAKFSEKLPKGQQEQGNLAFLDASFTTATEFVSLMTTYHGSGLFPPVSLNDGFR